MIPVACQVSANGQDRYGDCVRACVASILELGAPDVPHFYYDGDGEAGMRRIREWLEPRGQSMFITHYDGSAALEDILTIVSTQNPGATYMLMGHDGTEDHCVVCQHRTMTWNPSWAGGSLVGPLSTGTWVVAVIAVR